ncbi:unnamed protein product, partial [Amoebophrya sp. A25]
PACYNCTQHDQEQQDKPFPLCYPCEVPPEEHRQNMDCESYSDNLLLTTDFDSNYF